MIPKENLIKHDQIQFKGKKYPSLEVINNLRYSYNPVFLGYPEHHLLREIYDENIIFPLEFVSSENPAGENGCRIHDWKILTTPQVLTAMKIQGRFERVVVPHFPVTRFFAADLSENPILQPCDFEEYDKFLNVTYLVNDEFLQKWIDPHFNIEEEKNLAKKIVKDCSVEELLYAVRRKLDKR